jgi:hypothetical protein
MVSHRFPFKTSHFCGNPVSPTDSPFPPLRYCQLNDIRLRIIHTHFAPEHLSSSDGTLSQSIRPSPKIILAKSF